MEQEMALDQEQLEKIGDYVRIHLREWIGEVNHPVISYDADIRERFVRVEEELRTQRELMKQGFEFMEKRFEQIDKRFEQVDKRFEQVDKRFEQVDKRFEQVDKRFDDFNKRFTQMMWFIGIVFSLIAAMIPVLFALNK